MLLAVLLAMAAQAGLAHDASAPAQQQAVGSQPAPSDEILDAVANCVDVVKAHGAIDFAPLTAAGWQSGGRNQTPARPPMPATTDFIFGKGNVILIVSRTGLTASCKTVSRISNDAQEGEVRAGIIARFAAQRFNDYPGDAPFKAAMTRMMSPAEREALLINDADRFAVSVATRNGVKFMTVLITPKIQD